MLLNRLVLITEINKFILIRIFLVIEPSASKFPWHILTINHTSTRNKLQVIPGNSGEFINKVCKHILSIRTNGSRLDKLKADLKDVLIAVSDS